MNSWQGRRGGGTKKVPFLKAAGLILMGKVSNEMTRKRNGCHYESVVILYQLFPEPFSCLWAEENTA